MTTNSNKTYKIVLMEIIIIFITLFYFLNVRVNASGLATKVKGQSNQTENMLIIEYKDLNYVPFF